MRRCDDAGIQPPHLSIDDDESSRSRGAVVRVMRNGGRVSCVVCLFVCVSFVYHASCVRMGGCARAREGGGEGERAKVEAKASTRRGARNDDD
jgi:hypothetical protein